MLFEIFLIMQRVGFEPTKALSHRILSPADLTTLEPLHKKFKVWRYKKLYKPIILSIIETTILVWQHLFPFRTQKLSRLCY